MISVLTSPFARTAMAIHDAGAMNLEHPVVFRPTGWSRYIDVIFLAGWLVGWLFGECFALVPVVSLIASVIARLVERPVPHALEAVAGPGATSVFLLFRLFWLTLWTHFGTAAAYQFLRSLAGHDRVRLTSEGLLLEQHAGPFHRRRLVPRDAIRRVRVRLHDGALVIDTRDGTQVITTLGTPAVRESLRESLRQQIAFPDPAECTRLERETPPHDWQVDEPSAANVANAATLDVRITQPTRRARAISASIAWAVTALVSLAWLASLRAESPGPGSLLDLALTLLVATGAAWISWGHSEWLARPGRLTHRRRFGPWTREHVFDQGWLELAHKSDSDGDSLYTLRVNAPTATNARPRTIARATHDPHELWCFAQWLAARTRFPLNDLRP
jgi:hypothetical protein